MSSNNTPPVEVSHRRNNFDTLRLLAAMFVIFSHAFGFCSVPDPVAKYTGRLPGGQLAVYIFFVMSGYLILESWYRKPELNAFLMKRMLRIFPALIVVILLTVFLFGPLLTELTLKEYFSSTSTWTYFINISLWKMQFNLPGISYNHLPVTLNAPIWTLFFEFLMYLSIACFGMLGFFKIKSKKIFFIWMLFSCCIIADMYGVPQGLFILKISASSLVRFFIYFYLGALYRYYAKEKKMNVLFALIFLAATIFNRQTIWFNFFAPLFVTSFVFWFGFMGRHPLKGIVKKGDFSYGLYIYGYIIQNFVQHFFDCRLQLPLKIALSIALTLPFAWFSWRFIESKALKLKVKI
jgi:peptidoglycan/LPS O-acetylase OafA/YrhL